MAKAKRDDDTRLRTKKGQYVEECTFCSCPVGCACEGNCSCGSIKPAGVARRAELVNLARLSRRCPNDVRGPARRGDREPAFVRCVLAKDHAGDCTPPEDDPQKASRSGKNIPEMDRRTVAVKLRLSREVSEQLRELAMLSRITLSEAVAGLIGEHVGRSIAPPPKKAPSDDARDSRGKLLPPCLGGAPAPKPKATKVHRRHSDNSTRPDLYALAICNNINGPIADDRHMTSERSEVTCKRCLRILKDQDHNAKRR